MECLARDPSSIQLKTNGVLFRCVQEPARTIEGVHYHQAKATAIDFEGKAVSCLDVYRHYESGDLSFDLPYDKLVIAVGTKSNTFGIPGLASREEERSATGTDKANVFFLKQLEHARAIRHRIIECFERASSPFVSEAEKKRLLTFVVVGGGPTSIEFTSELCDFIADDVGRWYRDLQSDHQVIVVEAGKHLLGSFDSSLSDYVEQTLLRRKVDLLTKETVREVKDVSVVLGNGTEIPFGLCVWSTGNAPLKFVKNLGLEHSQDHRILVDNNLRALGQRDVFAIGDCAVNKDKPLTMLAQVANQQGAHLAKCLNAGLEKDFTYKFLGAMASLGTFKAVADLDGPKLKGVLAFLTWRSAYWTMLVSISNKILIPMYWFKSFFFGRDTSKF